MPSLKVFREGFTTFFVGIIGSLGAGLVLSGMSANFALIPGLALLLPAALGARGTIYGALGSRLSSAMHLGLVKRFSWRHRLIRKNVDFAHKATLFISLLAAFIASGLAKISDIPANPFLLFFISMTSGVIAGRILIILTNFIASQAFHRGWDPDNVTAPLIATIGDFVTVPILFGMALLALRLPQIFLMMIFIFITIYVLWQVRGYFLSSRFLTLVVSVVLQTLAGVFLERFTPTLLMTPSIFVFLPAFLAQGGNLASFVTSRLSTQLHLGIIGPEFALKGNVVNEILTISLLSILIFPLLGVSAFFIQAIIGIPHLPLFQIIRITFEGGFLNTLFVAIIMGFSISILAWRLNLDPDDVTIPLLSAFADFFGILFLLLVI